MMIVERAKLFRSLNDLDDAPSLRFGKRSRLHELHFVTDVAGVCEGDEVVIFSSAAGNNLDGMADVLGTISYEIMTSISARVKRIYVRE